MTASGLFPNLLQAAQRTDLSLGEGRVLVIQWGVILVASLVAAYWDLRERRIPNALTFPLFLGGLVWQVWLTGFPGFLDGVMGCVLVAMPFLVLFLYAGGGAGDAKMMGAVGAWLGVSQGLIALVAVVISGAVLGLLYAASQKRLDKVMGHLNYIVMTWIARIGQRGAIKEALLMPAEEELTPMPYALPILCGICIAATGALL